MLPERGDRFGEHLASFGVNAARATISESESESLCDPMDCIVHGILQARLLEWVAFLFSSVSSQSRD